MKRIHLNDDDNTNQDYKELPPELWIHILAYLSTRMRYMYITVCRAWGCDRGLIDLSMSKLVCRETQSFHTTARLPNITSLGVYPLQSDRLGPTLKNNLRSLSLHHTYDYCYLNLSSFINLTSLNVGPRVCVDILSLTPLTRLRKLSVSENQFFITGESILHILTGLVKLVLKGCILSFNDAHLTTMRNLETLHIEQADNITNKGISTLTNLRCLSLIYGNQFSGDLLRPLTLLKSLKLGNGTYFKSHQVAHLTALESLSLPDRMKHRHQILRCCTRLTSLTFTGNVLAYNDDRMGNALYGLHNLKALRIDSDARAYIPNVCIEALTTLTSLSIVGHSSVYRGSLMLSKLPCLRHLEITLDLKDIQLPVDWTEHDFPLALVSLSIVCDSEAIPLLYSLATNLTNLTVLRLVMYGDEEPDDLWASFSSLGRLTRLKCSKPHVAKSYLPYIDISRPTRSIKKRIY